MNTKTGLLTLIVPCYKQASTIVANIKQLQNVLVQVRSDYEIIVVIDGDIDGTEKKLRQARLTKVRIITYARNQGKSYALRQGMKKAQGDYIMFLDAGMEIDPNGISMLLEHLFWYEADIIVGSKRHPASKVNYPLKRKILSYGYYYVIKLLFGLRVKDTQAGIKIFRREVLQAILPHLLEKKFAGDLEMLVVAKKYGFDKIYEAPINLSYSDDFFSSAIEIRAIIGIFLDTLAIWYRKNIVKYYDKK